MTPEPVEAAIGRLVKFCRWPNWHRYEGATEDIHLVKDQLSTLRLENDRLREAIKEARSDGRHD